MLLKIKEQATRYRYEKRIKELEDQVARLRGYRDIALEIYDATANLSGKDGGMNKPWILGLFRGLFK